MAIVKMKKLTLFGMQLDKEAIFNALIKSKSAQIKRSADTDAVTPLNVAKDREKLIEKITAVEDAISFVKSQTETYNAENKKVKDVEKVKIPENGFARPLTEVTYDDFLSFGKNAQEIDNSVNELALLRTEIAELNSKFTQLQGEYDKLYAYRNLPHPTNHYTDTENAFVRLCQLPASETENLKALAAEFDTVTFETVDVNQSFAIVVVVAHKSQGEFFDKAMALGLIQHTVTCEVMPKVKLEDVERQINGVKQQLKQISAKTVAYANQIPLWKVYVDYLGICEKKLAAESDLTNTVSTFALEAYYPAEAEEKVTKAILSVSDCVALNCEDIGEGEFAPTLVKNNKVVGSFEGITNMYSPPAYGGIDPNPVMSVFYFLIFGFMVADIGYGLLLVIAGITATFVIKQRTGIKTMCQMFGICGISAIIIGALFGSCFCYQLYEGIIPSPDKYPMVMMILSLILGIIHICAGIACKMALKIQRKQHLAAWLCDFPWIVVFVAFVFAIWNSALDMAAYEPYNGLHMPDIIPQVSLYICLGALAIALVFAGLGSKGVLGKLTKSFGAAYGIINYFSDIMSYIRVFGLMLSSALVGSVINDISQMVLSGGGLGYVFAFVILIVAHLFNLAIGVLSVYIHNGRLQYVEFFGKFYEGDGELFVPFCSDTKYTLLSEQLPANGK